MRQVLPGSNVACQRCETELELDDLRCPMCGLAVPARLALPEGTQAQVLRCQECAAAISYVAEAQAPICAFCGAVMKLEQPADPVEQAELVLPFLTDPQAAREAIRGWMARLGFFRPTDLSRTATVESIRPLWWAGWVVNARALVSWAADSDAGSRRSAWAPHAGQTVLDFTNLLVCASRGLTFAEAAQLGSRYNLATGQASPPGPPGAIVEQFELQRSAARRRIGDAIEATAAARVEAGHIPGNRFRHVHVSVLLQGLRTQRVALPAHVLAYRYRGKLYRAIVHGQDSSCRFGQAPYSWAKILAVGAAAVLVLGLILLAAVLAVS